MKIVKIKHNGRLMRLSELAEEVGIAKSAMYHRWRKAGEPSEATAGMLAKPSESIRYNGREWTLRELSSAKDIRRSTLHDRWTKLGRPTELPSYFFDKREQIKVVFEGREILLDELAQELGLTRKTIYQRWVSRGRQREVNYDILDRRTDPRRITLILNNSERVETTVRDLPQVLFEKSGRLVSADFCYRRHKNIGRPDVVREDQFEVEISKNNQGSAEWQALGTEITPEKQARLNRIPALTRYELSL